MCPSPHLKVLTDETAKLKKLFADAMLDTPSFKDQPSSYRGE